MSQLITRQLGRTGRSVTTLGLGGQASIQWPGEGIEPVSIIEKAIRAGITYLDTSNIYGPSQNNYGKAFKRLGLIPGSANYDRTLREKIFLAGKTHIRTARRPDSEHFFSDYSEGMLDDFKVKTAVDDVRRSLSLIFGDGKGNYPKDAYMDSIQFHNLNTLDEVDMLYEGFEDPHPGRPWMGALAAMLDIRDGTNHTGCNPGLEKLVRHIGITGHWNTAAHIYAIQRDTRRIIDTLLVAINPSDGQYFGHKHNAIEVAQAADMGIIGMKVFADASYYHKPPKFSNSPEDVYYEIGSEKLPSPDLIGYSLSISGVDTVIVGIGHIDKDTSKCQLVQNLAAAQISAPLSIQEMVAIEKKVEAAGKHGANASFQRPAIGLTAPRNVGIDRDFSMPAIGYRSVRISWDTAYAGNSPIDRYEVLRNGIHIGTVPHHPQYTLTRFRYNDRLEENVNEKEQSYSVAVVDSAGNREETRNFNVE